METIVFRQLHWFCFMSSFITINQSTRHVHCVLVKRRQLWGIPEQSHSISSNVGAMGFVWSKKQTARLENWRYFVVVFSIIINIIVIIIIIVFVPLSYNSSVNACKWERQLIACLQTNALMLGGAASRWTDLVTSCSRAKQNKGTNNLIVGKKNSPP